MNESLHVYVGINATVNSFRVTKYGRFVGCHWTMRTREDRQKCLTQLKSKVDETADGSMLYYYVHEHNEELKSSRKRRFIVIAKRDMHKDEYDCMTKDMDDDYMADHDADADDGTSSNNNIKINKTSLGSTDTKEPKLLGDIHGSMLFLFEDHKEKNKAIAVMNS